MASDGSIKITTELDNISAEKAMSNFSSKVKSGLKGVATTAVAVSAALAGIALYSAKTGIEFETAFAGVKKTVNATDEELQRFRNGIREMSKDIPQSATAISGVAEAAGQLGIKNENLLDFTRVMSDLGVATNMSSVEAAASLARLANITQMPQEQFSNLGSVVVALGNKLATTESEVTEMGLRLAGAGEQVGMSEAQILGLSGALSSVGIEADAGGSAMSTVMSKIQLAVEQGGESLNQFADVAGMSADDFKTAFETDASGAIVSFITGLGTLDERGKSAIGTLADMEITEIRQRDALLRLSSAGDVLSQSLGIATQAWDENNALTNEAEQRYETLESRLQILKNNVDDFGISIYDSLRDPLKNTVNESIGYVERLHDAFNAGGLKSVVAELGEVFDDVTDNIAGTSKIAAGIVMPLKNIVSEGTKVAKSVLPPFAKASGELAENLDMVIPLLVSGATAIKGYSVAKTAITAVKGLSSAYKASAIALDLYVSANGLSTVATAASTGAITLKQIATGLLTKQLGIATAAHAAFNAIVMANPIALAVTAVAALTTGLIAYSVATDDSAEKSYKLSDSQKKILAACKEATDSINEQRSAREESIQAIDMEYDGYRSLVTELQSITDANGNVKEGYEKRVEVITGELASALGIEIELLDGQIQKYGEVVSAIEEVITKKNAEALCAALQEEMATAYKDSRDAMKAYSDAADVAEKKEKALGEAKQRLVDVNEKYANSTSPAAISAMTKAEKAVEDAQEAYDKASDSVDAAKTSLNELSSEVNNYDALVAAMAGGSTAEIESAMNALLSGYQSYTTEMLATSQTAQSEMLGQAKSNTDALQMLINEGGAMYQAFGDDAANAAAKAISEFQKMPGGVASAIEMIGPQASGAMVATLAQADLDGKLSEESKSSYIAFLDGLVGLDEETRSKFESAVEGALSGLEGFDAIRDKAEEEGISFLEALREVLAVNSPSKKVMEIFEGVWEGASDGLDSGKEELNTKGKETCNSFLDTLRNSGIAEAARGIGSKIMSFFGFGVSEQTENSRLAGKSNADAAGQGAGSVDPTGIGSRFGSLLGGGIGGMVSLLFGKGKANADSAESGASSVDPTRTGGSFGGKYASGVGSKSGAAYNSGSDLATNADSGAGSKDGYNSGSNFGAGFIDGIGAWLGRAAKAAADLAISAYNALRNALGERSPSRKAKKSGKNFDLGLGVGIEENSDYPVSEAEGMSERLLNAIDTEGAIKKLRSMDTSYIMDRINSAVDDRQVSISEKLVASVEARENLDDIYKQNKPEIDYKRLEKVLLKRPVVTVMNIDSRQFATATSEQMEDKISRNAKVKAMLGGNKK